MLVVGDDAVVKVAPFAPGESSTAYMRALYEHHHKKLGEESNQRTDGDKDYACCFKSLKTPAKVTIYTCMVIFTPICRDNLQRVSTADR